MTEQDREMLRLAAKAGRVPVVWDDEAGCYLRTDTTGTVPWRPRDDDGDALRLAVSSGVLAGIGECDCCAEAHYQGGEEPIRVRFSSSFPDCEAPDAFSATRLAIVRAAAEIGRNMA